jgi:hypothetical protein
MQQELEMNRNPSPSPTVDATARPDLDPEQWLHEWRRLNRRARAELPPGLRLELAVTNLGVELLFAWAVAAAVAPDA